jgi:periplasmic protein TonB
MHPLTWDSIYATLSGEKSPVPVVIGLALLVMALHLKSILWLNHQEPPTRVLPPPLEVFLLPAPLKKVELEPVNPQPVVEPKIKPAPPKPKPKPKIAVKPAPKPTPVPKPKPVLKTPPVVKAAPMVKPTPQETIAPIAPVIQTPSPLAPQQPNNSKPDSSKQESSHAKLPVATRGEANAKTEAKQAPHGNDSGNGVNSGVVALERIQPKYPARAISRHIEGKVTLEFTISTTGSVVNPVVVSAQPPDVFDEAALQAIRKWKFKQKIVNGNAVEQRATQTLQFKLASH